MNASIHSGILCCQSLLSVVYSIQLEFQHYALLYYLETVKELLQMIWALAIDLEFCLLYIKGIQFESWHIDFQTLLFLGTLWVWQKNWYCNCQNNYYSYCAMYRWYHCSLLYTSITSNTTLKLCINIKLAILETVHSYGQQSFRIFEYCNSFNYFIFWTFVLFTKNTERIGNTYSCRLCCCFYYHCCYFNCSEFIWTTYVFVSPIIKEA